VNSADPLSLLEANDLAILAVVVRSVLRTTKFLTPGARARLVGLDERLSRAIAEADAEQGDSVLASQGSVLTVTEAAAVRGCSTRYVRKLCQDGRLPARWTAAGWLIEAVPGAEPTEAVS
jgi:excisionase family DNA binding protein